MRALYRKYRPTKLDEVIGQEQVTKTLGSSLSAGKLTHAYLFVGPRGCGKTSVARIFAHEINGFPYTIEDDYVDIIEIDGASNRGIDNIRELREKVMIAPTAGKYKVYIIDEVHMLTKEAFNALLKTLEEPPEHAVFIMATTDFYKVPATIVSRSQTYTFKLADDDTMFAFLKNVSKKENIKIEDEALSIIVKRGGGSFRDSLSLLDQISTLSSDNITKALVVSALGLPEDEKISELIAATAESNVGRVSALIKEILSAGIKPETLAEEMISFIISNPDAKYLSLLAKLPEVRAPFAEAKLLTALCFNPATVIATAPAATTIATPAIPTPAPAPVSTPAPVPAKSDTPFDFDTFISRVKGMNDAVAMQVSKCKHSFDGTTLSLYPDKNITKTILSRDGNKKILIEASEGIKVVIGEVGEDSDSGSKDALISKISDIMGGKVENDGQGGNPF